MKKRYILCSALFLLLLPLISFSGCAGGSSDDSASSSTPQTENASTTSSPEPSVDIFINQVDTDCFAPGFVEIMAYVSVIDEEGELIDGLDLSNFQISHNDNAVAAQEITFAPTNSLIPDPISVAVIMDYSDSITDFPEVQTAMEDAVEGFIDLMYSKDQAEIIKFNTGIKYLQPFTSDKELLKAGIAYLKDVIGGYTYLYDTLYKGIEDTTAQSGRKAVIAITDGVEKHEDNVPGDGRTMQNVIDLAQASEIPLFIIGLGTEINAVELQEMADETEGHFYQAATSDELEEIYDDISQLLNIGQYLFVYEAARSDEETAALVVSINYNGLTDSTTFPLAICP